MNAADAIIRELPKGLLNWYDFKLNSRVLHVADKVDGVTECLEEKGLQVSCISPTNLLEKVVDDKYDYIIMIHQIETVKNPEELLKVCKSILKEDGTLLLGVENRFGLRYFCGDRDPYTNRSFDGVENYHRTNVTNGRCYSRAEVDAFLKVAGFESKKNYSVMPNLECPQLIYAENYLPKENLAIRYVPMYNYPDSVFLEEEFIYNDLADNNMFHAMANAYLIECTSREQMSDVSQVTISMDRGRADSLLTVIRENNTVEKHAVYEEGFSRLKKLVQHNEELKSQGIAVVDAKLEGHRYVMPYVEAELAVNYLRNLYYTDREKFISEMDRFREQILKSSTHVEDTGEDGVVLEKAYFDMVPINCFFVNGEFVFFDQEFACENYSANVMVLRTIEFVYHGDSEMEKEFPKKFFLDRYSLSQNLDKWYMDAYVFLRNLRNEKELQLYHEKYRRDTQVVHTNRQRVNYSEVEYQRLFVDIFEGLEKRKLILFGSGAFAKKFIALYGQRYPVNMIIDNSMQKWGTKLDGVSIQSPEILNTMDRDEYKVIICIKNYPSVLQQLRDAGVVHIGIYDSNKDYNLPEERQVVTLPKEDEAPKKYHIGYTCGVYDLFHIGHLNMFKRAKEQCDYLIVGVVTDEGACKFKKKEPFIPFEERIEMVRSCKYVDEAVEIPVNFGGTRDAYRLYHFDVQFSGSDYENDPVWLAEREYLRKHGSDLVFFPYTEQTSSTKIKALINKHLF